MTPAAACNAWCARRRGGRAACWPCSRCCARAPRRSRSGLHPSAATSTLAGRSSDTYQATERYRERFGDHAIVVLVRGPLQQLVLTENLGRLLGLEGCLSGNKPAGQAAPGGERGAVRRAGAHQAGPGRLRPRHVHQLRGRGDPGPAQAASSTPRAEEAEQAAAAARGLAKRQGKSKARAGRAWRARPSSSSTRSSCATCCSSTSSTGSASTRRRGSTTRTSSPRSCSTRAAARRRRRRASRTCSRRRSRRRSRCGSSPGLSDAERERATALVRAAVRMPDFALRNADGYTVTGVPVLAEDLSDALAGSVARLLLVAVVVMAGVLALVFRRRLRLVPLAVALGAVALTFGLMALVGAPLTMASIAVLPVLLGLGRRLRDPVPGADRRPADARRRGGGGARRRADDRHRGAGDRGGLPRAAALARCRWCAASASCWWSGVGRRARVRADGRDGGARDARRAAAAAAARWGARRAARASCSAAAGRPLGAARRPGRAAGGARCCARRWRGRAGCSPPGWPSRRSAGSSTRRPRCARTSRRSCRRTSRRCATSTRCSGPRAWRASSTSSSRAATWPTRRSSRGCARSSTRVLREARYSAGERLRQGGAVPGAVAARPVPGRRAARTARRSTRCSTPCRRTSRRRSSPADRRTANLAFGIRLMPLDEQHAVIERVRAALRPAAGRDRAGGRAAGAGGRGERRARVAVAADRHAARRPARGRPRAARRPPAGRARVGAARPDRAGDGLVGGRAVRAADPAQPDVGDARRARDRALDRVRGAARRALPRGARGRPRAGRGAAAHVRVDGRRGARVRRDRDRGLRRARVLRRAHAAGVRHRHGRGPLRVPARRARGPAGGARAGRAPGGAGAVAARTPSPIRPCPREGRLARRRARRRRARLHHPQHAAHRERRLARARARDAAAAVRDAARGEPAPTRDANIAVRARQRARGRAAGVRRCAGPDVLNVCELAEQGPVVLAFLVHRARSAARTRSTCSTGSRRASRRSASRRWRSGATTTSCATIVARARLVDPRRLRPRRRGGEPLRRRGLPDDHVRPAGRQGGRHRARVPRRGGARARYARARCAAGAPLPAPAAAGER